MRKVAPISTRKDDHIRINLEQDVRSNLTSGLEKYRFINEALPEIDLDDVDTSLSSSREKSQSSHPHIVHDRWNQGSIQNQYAVG